MKMMVVELNEGCNRFDVRIISDYVPCRNLGQGTGFSFKGCMNLISIMSGSGTEFAGDVDCDYIHKNIARKLRKEIRSRRQGETPVPLLMEVLF